MITVFSATNRRHSLTATYARHVHRLLLEQGAAAQYFSFEDLPLDLFHPDMYESAQQSAALAEIQDRYVIAADKFYFVIPEYNGSFPGVLKLFWDACSIREYKASFAGKKAALLGVASGRAGNLRGMEHFTGALNYVQITVLPNRLPVSVADKMVNDAQQIIDEATLSAIRQQVEQFISF